MKTVILDTPYHLSLLAELGKPETSQPRVEKLVEELYASLFETVVDKELEQAAAKVKTRVYAKDRRGVFKGKIFKRNQKAVVADIIRAGIQPSHLFYIRLTEILDPKNIRQDHIMSQRVETSNGVTGTTLMGSKIGGSVKNAIVFLPDPMGATGHSMEEIIGFYEKKYGPAKKYVAVHLIVTPQYLKRVGTIKAKVAVYAARQDKGLTKDDFIYPGLGGMGEIINNTLK
ncbi:hypothetical protein JXA05_03460 [Candidatus Peregrinibacteria bacterium]|nr:hypothetical protein [Candidatus Peregrinibacteria bacterium]